MEYSYDTLDRLIRVTSGERSVSYAYDALGRRISERCSDGSERLYLYEGDNELGVCSASGEIEELRIFGAGFGGDVGAAVALELGSRVYFPVHDFRGNVAVLFDESGEAVEGYRYSAFGEMEEFCSGEPVGNPWRFSSKRVDAEGLSYFGRRHYLPSLGRWLTRDPAGLSQGPNLYAYCLNNPFAFFDLRGLDLGALSFWSHGPFATSGSTLDLDEVDPLKVDHVDWSRLRELIADDIGADILAPDFPFRSWERRDVLGWPDFEAGLQEKSFFEVIRAIDPSANYHDAFVVINGVWNTAAEARMRAQFIAEMVRPHPVVMVYNATHGGMIDLREARANVDFDVATTPSYVLRDAWRYIFDRVSPEVWIWTYGHSQGGAHICLGLRMMTNEEQRRIRVRAFAPARFIPDDTCGSVIHYRAKWYRDPVPTYDAVGASRSRHNTVILKTPEGAPLFDHEWMGATYGPALKEDLDDILEKWAI